MMAFLLSLNAGNHTAAALKRHPFARRSGAKDIADSRKQLLKNLNY